VALATAASLVRLPPSLVERAYSATVYVRIQPLITSLSNLSPIALFDPLVVVFVVAFGALTIRDLRGVRGWRRPVVLLLWRAVIWSAAVYIAFLAVWGLNYRRVRLVDALPFDQSRITPASAANAAATAIDRLNALSDRVHAQGWADTGTIDPALSAALDRAIQDVGRSQVVIPARPKATLLDWWFRRAGVDGMTDPFLLETLVVRDLLPFERPFVIAHEWSHLAGIADEGEANFLGWLACIRAAPPAQYSGWLFLYSELTASLPPRDRTALAAALDAGPRADLRAIRDRLSRNVSPRVAAAGWRVYDSYLKANRVEAGAASYAEVVRLVLGARLASGGAPLSE
jgi:hypothetical protein